MNTLPGRPGRNDPPVTGKLTRFTTGPGAICWCTSAAWVAATCKSRRRAGCPLSYDEALTRAIEAGGCGFLLDILNIDAYPTVLRAENPREVAQAVAAFHGGA